jgi:hypothetical protein
LVANVGGGATHGVLPDIVRKLRSPDPELVLLGAAPGSSKPYAYVGDTAKFMVECGLKPDKHILANVGPDDHLTIEYMALLAMDYLKIKKRIRWDVKANWRGDNRVVKIDNTLVRSLGWGYGDYCLTSYAALSKTLCEITGIGS